ncbi:MAG TPA: AAA family ATPase [Streptosporangiaceae bacterium]|nr:AAA family ATPase [Streptosporangiaceae bacterium]
MRAKARELIQPVRGREAELAALERHLGQLLYGQGTVALVEGRAGMGKSRLLQEVATMARQRSIRVGSGVAAPCNQMVQLFPLMEALFDGASPILERTGLGEAHKSPEQRYWLLQDLEALLERAALDTPLLVCVDDLQWADNDTVAALRSLTARLATVPVAWILAFRPGQGLRPLRDALDYLERKGTDKIVLGPLDRAGVALVAADVLQAEPDAAVLKMAERAGGSPFLLVELLSGLREEGLVHSESGRAELVESRLPRRVSESMRRRLERMSDPARQAAAVAAALGRRFSASDLAAMLELPASALLTPIEELIHADMLIEQGDKLAFGHDLILEAVRGSMPVSVRHALDRQAATVLLAGGALPVEVATQLAASAEPGDEAAIVTLFKAAEALGTTDPGTAADLGQRALELAPRQHALRGPIVAQTAVWLHAAARGEEAKSFADTAMRQVLPPEQEAEVCLSIAGMFAVSPDVRAEASRRALALPGLPEILRARHLALLVHNLVTAGRPDEDSVLEKAMKAVQDCHDIPGRFALEVAGAGLAYSDGRFGQALELVEAALRTGLDTSDETREHVARQWRCEVLNVLDRLEESIQISTENVAAAQRDRQGWALAIFEIGRGRQLLQLGRLLDAAAVLEGRFTLDTAHQVLGIMDAAGVTALGRVALHTGDRGQARQATEIAHVMLGQSAPSVRRHAAWLLALRAMADGDPSGAHRWLCALGDDERLSILPLFPMDMRDEPRLVHIALAVQDRELAVHVAASAQRRSALNPGVRSLAAVAAHASGLLNHSCQGLAEAVQLFEGGPRPLELAAALEDLAAASAEEGDTQAAVDAFGRALALYAEAGAAWDAGRVRGRLRALGVRRRLASAAPQGRGWAAMTDSELTVAQLVAQGFTNREVAEQLFVSPHTVSSHLRHVFAKLGVNSRVELTRQAGIHGWP